MDVGGTGKTLCIPSTFITFGGHAMDYKVHPLSVACHFTPALEDSVSPMLTLLFSVAVDEKLDISE